MFKIESSVSRVLPACIEWQNLREEDLLSRIEKARHRGQNRSSLLLFVCFDQLASQNQWYAARALLSYVAAGAVWYSASIIAIWRLLAASPSIPRWKTYSTAESEV